MYGVDIAELVAAGRWQAALDYVDGLPAASRLNEAIANDPVLAAQIVAAQDDDAEKVEWAPRVSEFGLVEMLLSQILDAVRGDTATAVSISGNKPAEVKPTPTPKTEIAKALAAKEKAKGMELGLLLGFSEEDLS